MAKSREEEVAELCRRFEEGDLICSSMWMNVDHHPEFFILLRHLEPNVPDPIIQTLPPNVWEGACVSTGKRYTLDLSRCVRVIKKPDEDIVEEFAVELRRHASAKKSLLQRARARADG